MQGRALLASVLGARRDRAVDDAAAPFLDRRVDQLRRLLDAVDPPTEVTVTEVLAPLYLRALFGYTDIAADLPALVRATIDRTADRSPTSGPPEPQASDL
jgi:hypothetical protein